MAIENCSIWSGMERHLQVRGPAAGCVVLGGLESTLFISLDFVNLMSLGHMLQGSRGHEEEFKEFMLRLELGRKDLRGTGCNGHKEPFLSHQGRARALGTHGFQDIC